MSNLLSEAKKCGHCGLLLTDPPTCCRPAAEERARSNALLANDARRLLDMAKAAAPPNLVIRPSRRPTGGAVLYGYSFLSTGKLNVSYPDQPGVITLLDHWSWDHNNEPLPEATRSYMEAAYNFAPRLAKAMLRILATCSHVKMGATPDEVCDKVVRAHDEIVSLREDNERLRRELAETTERLAAWQQWGDKTVASVEPLGGEAVWSTEDVRKFIGQAVADCERFRNIIYQADVVSSAMRDVRYGEYREEDDRYEPVRLPNIPRLEDALAKCRRAMASVASWGFRLGNFVVVRMTPEQRAEFREAQ